MHKKLITTCAAIAAFALLVGAPVASASPVLTSEGKAVAAGTSIKGSNTGNVIFTQGSYTVECNTADLTATITSNTGTKIKMESGPGGLAIGGTGTSGDCTSPAMGPISMSWTKMCFETVTGTDNITITGCGANITMTTNITNAGLICKYSGASMSATFTTNSDATMRFNSQQFKLSEGGILCPTEFRLDLDLDLSTTLGGTLSIS